MTARLREHATLLGPRKSLVAILTQEAGAAVRSKPAIVILNAGIIHRVGPNRMHVDLARQLAAAGHLVVRFDLAGIGDSDPRTDSLPAFEASLHDIRELLDSLQATRHTERVILIGLCSGANQAVVYAGHDPRIAGVVLIDPLIPRTTRYYVNYYASRILRIESWKNLTSRRHRFWRRMRKRRRAAAEDIEDAGAALPERELWTFLEDAYRRTVTAGVRMLAIFTGDLPVQHNYREQLIDAFESVNFGDLLQLEYFGRSDHTFSLRVDREKLFRVIGQWVAGVPGTKPSDSAPENAMPVHSP